MNRILIVVLLAGAVFGQTTTPNLHLNIPTPGTQIGTWGPLLNNNFSVLDSYLSGGTQLPFLNAIAVNAQQSTVSSSGIFTNTQMNEYAKSIIGNCSPLTEFQAVQGASAFATDAVTGCIAAPAGSTVHQGNGVAGFANTSAAAAFAVGGYLQGRCLANGTQCWGMNSVAIDTPGLTSGVILTHEFDTQPQNAASAYVSGGAQSVLFAPTAGTFPMNAFAAVSSQSGKWADGFHCNPASVGSSCLNTGTTGTPNGANGNFGSQPITMQSWYWTGSGLGSDQFQLATSIGAGSPPSFVNLQLTHPAGIASGNFLIGSSVNFGITNAGGFNALFHSTGLTASRDFTFPDVAGVIPAVVANGSTALNTSSVTTATCDGGKTATATGTLSTDKVDWSFNAAPAASNKYGAFLQIYAVPSADTVTFYTCNASATTSTPTAMTVNWSVRRP